MHKDDEPDRENAVETTLRALRGMIFDGQLRGNQPLRQDDLAQRLGTSRHPIREALGRLGGEGLVTFRARRGYVVTALDPNEITEIFDMRAVLEEHAGYFAALNRTASDVERVEEMLWKMKAIDSPNADKMVLWSVSNREFHSRLFAASRRKHLCRTIGSLRDSVESYIRTTVAEQSLSDAWKSHEEIFEAFRDADALQLARLSRRHVRHSADTLLERLRAALDLPSRDASSKPQVAFPERKQFARAMPKQ